MLAVSTTPTDEGVFEIEFEETKSREQITREWELELNAAMHRTLKSIVLSGRKLMQPAPDMTVSEWADAYRVLPDTAANPGPWRTEEAPHTREIMDNFNDPTVSQTSMMKSAQCAGTEVINNTVGYIIDLDPQSILLMQPTDKDARFYSQNKLEPMIEDCTRLKKKVYKGKNIKDKDSSTLRKVYPGGFLNVIAGTSPTATRQRTVPVTIGDDIDGITTSKEGDVVMRLMKRATTFTDKYNMNISTPTIKGESKIEALYLMGDRRKYHVNCIHCGYEQVFKWENVTWEKDVDLTGKVTNNHCDTAKIACEGCGVLLTEGERKTMLRAGKWVAERPWIKHHRSYWINEVSSTLSSLKNIAQAIVDAGDNPEKLESLYNTVFGLPYERVQGEESDPLTLMEMVKDSPVGFRNLDNRILFLTAAVDLQAGSSIKENKEQRLEVEIHGWAYKEEDFLVYKCKIPGMIKGKEVWQQLDNLWLAKFTRADGYELPILRKGIDAGYESATVYDYVRGREHEGIYAIKGSNLITAPLLPKNWSYVDKGRVRMLILGTQMIKHELFSRLKNVKEEGPKFTHFPRTYCNAEYFKQLTSEKLITVDKGLFEKKIFVKKSKEESNEALDLWVYNYALLRHVAANWDKVRENVGKQVSSIRQAEPDYSETRDYSETGDREEDFTQSTTPNGGQAQSTQRNLEQNTVASIPAAPSTSSGIKEAVLGDRSENKTERVYQLPQDDWLNGWRH